MKKKKDKYMWISVAAVALFLIVWQIFSTINSSGMMPAPTEVLKAFITNSTFPGDICKQCLYKLGL